MQLKALRRELSVCKVREVSAGVYGTELYFIGKTDEELSLVCETNAAPPDVLACEDGWRAFRIEGALDFSLMGVLAGVSAVLADAGISAVSTYNTDYILVKAENVDAALDALASAGYAVRDQKELVWKS